MRRLLALTLWAGVLAGCTSRMGANGNAGDEDDDADAVDADGDSSMTLGTGVTATDHDDDADTGEDTHADDGDDCGGFLGCGDFLVDGWCDFWAQDCSPGHKCTAVATTHGGGTFDANLCVPVGTAAIGEPCTMVADAPPGTDTCDAESMCYDVDSQTGIGTCVGLCQPPEANPTCPEGVGPKPYCKKHGAGVLNICLSSCNPLLSGECPTGQVCVAVYEGQELGGFICFPPAVEGLAGDSCDCANCCAAQHMCVTADEYGPDCAFDLCCTEYCDTEDSSFVCEGTDQVCVALFDPRTPEFGNVGRCVVP